MAILKTVSLLLMTDKQKNIRDYSLAIAGGAAAAVGTAFVVAELPALILTAGGIVLFSNAYSRLTKKDDSL